MWPRCITSPSWCPQHAEDTNWLCHPTLQTTGKLQYIPLPLPKCSIFSPLKLVILVHLISTIWALFHLLSSCRMDPGPIPSGSSDRVHQLVCMCQKYCKGLRQPCLVSKATFYWQYAEARDKEQSQLDYMKMKTLKDVHASLAREAIHLPLNDRHQAGPSHRVSRGSQRAETKRALAKGGRELPDSQCCVRKRKCAWIKENVSIVSSNYSPRINSTYVLLSEQRPPSPPPKKSPSPYQFRASPQSSLSPGIEHFQSPSSIVLDPPDPLELSPGCSLERSPQQPPSPPP